MRTYAVAIFAALSLTACGDLSTTAPTRTSVQSVVAETVAVPVAAQDIPAAVYSCVDRKAWTDAYIATHQFDTALVDLPSGERVYIDWQRHVYHVSGPTCRLVDDL